MHKKILIVEDDFEIANQIQNMLEAQNYSVIKAKDGKEGIALTKLHLPDLIICDVTMPRMNGYQFKKELNKDKKTSLIPFIFLTARIEHTNVRMGMDLGADDYLFKPPQSRELFASINTRLKKAEAIRNKQSKEIPSSQKQNDKDKDNILISINSIPTYLKPEKIKFILADRQYSELVFTNNKNLVLRKSLNNWEKILPVELFVRINRKTIVNLDEISQLAGTSTTGYKVHLKDKQHDFEISRRYSHKVREKFISRAIRLKID